MRQVKKFTILFISLVLLIGLAAGLDIVSDPSLVWVGQEANITVNAANDTLVNFSTTLGNLSANSNYTNSSGIATIRINSTVAGIAFVNASIESDYNITNVTFLAGTPVKIDTDISQNPLIAGNNTMVNLTAYDQYDNVNLSASFILNFQMFDIIGNKMSEMNLTRTPYTYTQIDNNRTDLILTNFSDNSSSVVLGINSTVAGNITITANIENITSSFNITFNPGEVYDFNIYCEDITCDRIVNQTVNITVEALDAYGNLLKDTVVNFNASAPAPSKFNSPVEHNSLIFSPDISTTQIDGTTSTVFRTDKRAGENIIYISSGNVNKSYVISGEADAPYDLFLNHSPDYVPANNQNSYSLTAQVTDLFLNPVLPAGISLTKKVHFIGSSQIYVLLNESGAATMLIGPTLYIETVNISAIYNDGNSDTDIMNHTNLSFVPGNLSRFVFYANPDTVIYQNGKGNHNSSLVLKALDEWGNPIPDLNVTMTNTNTTLGNLTIPGTNGTNVINSTTDSFGGIVANFVSNISVGNDTIVAENGSINASLVVEIKDSSFISATVDFEPKNIISGQRVNVTNIISIEGDTPMTRLSANAMLVLDNTGSMDPDYYAGTPADILLLSDNSGSMAGQIGNVRNAEVNFTRNLISNDRVGLVTFSSTVGTPGLSRNITAVQNQINSQLSGGSTATALAIQKAKNYLVNNTRPGARPIMILLSDGLPTQALPLSSGDPTFEAIDEADKAKKTLINSTYIKIYTIYFDTGDDSGIDTLKAIASPDSYYYATSSNIEEVYDNIAQQISDFDISTRQYGTDGFTSYNYMKTDVVKQSNPWSDNISLDDNVTDFKVQVDNPNVAFTLKSPDGTVYPRNFESGLLNRTGYYNVSIDSSKGRYIWIEPVNDTYYPDQDKTIQVPKGNWTINITTTSPSNVTFNITTYIDKISAVKIASHAFISSFDASRGDRAGLATYSNIPNPPGTVNTTSQSSYLLNGSTWDGYFEGNTPKKNYTLNFTGKYCTYPYREFGQCYLTVNGIFAGSFNNGSQNYSVDITDLVLNGSNTISLYDYYCIYNSCLRWGGWRSGWIQIKSYITNVTVFENGISIFHNEANRTLGDDPTSYIFDVSFNTTFNLTWSNASDNLDFYLYQGGTLVNKSTGSAGNSESFKATIYPGKVYYVEVNGTRIYDETNFTITADQMLTWNGYTANVPASLEDSNITQSFDKLNTSIDTMTAVGLTAIDEGLFEANNEFSNQSIRPSMVLMTDGLDNAGYRSLLNEANMAKNNNTVIHTIGFGNNESDIDPVLSQIASSTGGNYYFAPNTTVLKSIFRGIASNLTNFTASNTTLNLRLPKNYISGLSLATSKYIDNSSNSTNGTFDNFIVPTSPSQNNGEPVSSTIGNITLLSWTLPDLTTGSKWGVWYQLEVQGAGNVPLILPGSNITFFDMEANQTIIINITISADTNVGGTAADVTYIALGDLLLSPDPPVVFINEPSRMIVTAKYADGNPAIANIIINSNLGYFNDISNPLNLTVSGSSIVNFTSNTAGEAHVNAIGSNGNESVVVGNAIVIVRPKGKITVS